MHTSELRSPGSHKRQYCFGEFKLDLGGGFLLRSGEEVPLRPKSFEILTYLVERHGCLVGKEELIAAVWPDSATTDNSLAQCLLDVRRALADDSQTLIRTVARRGYVFTAAPTTAPVEFPHGQAAATGNPSLAVQESLNDAAAQGKARPWWRTPVAAGATAAVLVLTLLGAGIAYKFGGRDPVIDSVAVLPFANASGDPETEYLSDGITESLINDLAQFRGMRVIARSTVFRYKGKETDPQRIGQDLHVRTVLTGRLLQRGGTYIVQTELLDVERGSQLWGAQFDHEVVDVLALQQEMSREIAQKLRLRLTVEEEKRLAKSYATNPEAYQDYLKGLFWWNKSTLEGLNKGIEYFQNATEKDPNYAQAYAGMAFCYSSRAGFGFIAPKETFPQAKEAALKALEIDNSLAEAHTALGFIETFYDWDRVAAEKELQQAIELNSNYALAHMYYGLALGHMGRRDEAVAEEKRALDLDPLSVIINFELGWTYYFARRYEEVIDQERRTLEMDPNYAIAYFDLGGAYVQKSMYKDAVAVFEKMLAVSPDNPIGLSGLGYAYAVSGQRAEAQRMLDQLAVVSKHRYVSPVNRARIYTGLGLRDAALEGLEEAYNDRSLGGGATAINVEPSWDSLRSDPRFANLLLRMNLQP